jgi:protein-tyrosine phosphatase
MTHREPIRVLFVCLGNICRSPVGRGVLEHLVRERGLADRVIVDSCGTGSWHVGEPAHRTTTTVARRHGIDLSRHRARQVCPRDFDEFDYILAIDRSNLRDLLEISPERSKDRVRLLLSYLPGAPTLDVPDPYYGGADGFERTHALVTEACGAFLDAIVDEHRLA